MPSSSPTSDLRSPTSSSDSDSDVLIKVDNVSKKFCRDFKKSLWYGLKDTAGDILHPTHKPEDSSLRPSEFWANQNISFEVKRGECVGLIGHNGAGKTTLLKMLNGLIKPDTGGIEMRGRIGALIALGAGFNPILTGRENIYINGSILGIHKKEIDAKLEEIIDFAEIEEAIDAPVRTYSSGMQVRLGFAVSTFLRPDVLILDEVLAVGDMAFRTKCYKRIGQLQANAATILVSHDMSAITTACNRILYLSNGQGSYHENVQEGVGKYVDEQVAHGGKGGSESSFSFDAPVRNAEVGLTPSKIKSGDEIILEIKMDIASQISNVQIRCVVTDVAGKPLLYWDSVWNQAPITLDEGRVALGLVLGPMGLVRGEYKLDFNITTIGSPLLLVNAKDHLKFSVNTPITCSVPNLLNCQSLSVEPY